MACLVEAAWSASAEWGLYVWLSAVTGARRGEVVALQWDDVDLANGVLRLDENYVRTPDGMILKDTKTHQMRRVSIDEPTVMMGTETGPIDGVMTCRYDYKNEQCR